MNKLSCNVRKCNHNLFGMCEMSKISVYGENVNIKDETVCNSFEKKKFLKNIKHLGETKLFVDRLDGIGFIEDAYKLPQIDCRAENCMHNKDFICNSNIVFIEGFKAKNMDATNCASFKI